MSQQYPGGLITKNPVVPSGPYENSSASGVWTMDQAAQYIKAGNWPTAGNLPNYIEDVFSTYLYTGNGSTQTITNGIDLSGKGGLVWMKGRSGATNHALYDTVRGATKDLVSNSTAAETTEATGLTAFSGTGFSIGALAKLNTNAATYASWTFRKQAKFFDVVTYTGNGSAGARQIAHSLASAPGCVIVKRTDSTGNWWVGHRGAELSVGGNPASTSANFALNTTNAYSYTGAPYSVWAYGSTSSNFLVNDQANLSGVTYVAYLFAHNAGGFGLSGTDNVISCGSFTTDGSGNATVTLGYEPQWILYKISSAASNWFILDNMRGLAVNTSGGANGPHLLPNLSNAETPSGNSLSPTATGFQANGITPSATYIYIAIRRGPMKVPTSGTSVLGLSARSGTGANATVSGGQIADAALIKNRGSAVGDLFAARLTGTGYLETSSTAAEVAAGTTILQANPWDVMDGVKVGTTSTITNASSNTFINYLFRRAPGFMDVVCWTGVAGTAQQISHNLAAVPELIITKRRDAVSGWPIYNKTITATNYLILQDGRASAAGSTFWNNTEPTSSVFTAGQAVSPTGGTIVAYLFATCPGVSKVGSYTGSGTTKQIDCGFTGGARFVLIKRTDSTGDWYVYDSARGIVAGNDPYLFLNSTAAEVTSTDYVDTYSAGFELSSTAPAALNANGGTYIFLAIA